MPINTKPKQPTRCVGCGAYPLVWGKAPQNGTWGPDKKGALKPYAPYKGLKDATGLWYADRSLEPHSADCFYERAKKQEAQKGESKMGIEIKQDHQSQGDQGTQTDPKQAPQGSGEQDPRQEGIQAEASGEAQEGNGKGEGEGEGQGKGKGESQSQTDDPLARIIAERAEPFLREKLGAKVDRHEIEGIILDTVGKLDLGVVSVKVTHHDGSEVKVDGAHAQMPELLYWVNKRHNVYLYGPPGTGKSHTSRQVAEALKLEFGLISLNPQTPESKLFGYMDATGTYRSTLFRKIYQDGGVYCIDEIDNANDSLLTSLNSALANGHAAFPDGMVNRHDDFVLIATANTAGMGGDRNHAGRRPLDAATRDRFAVIKWDYDLKLEESLTLAHNPKGKPWLLWIRKVRTYCAEHHPNVVVSPRASMMGASACKDSPFTMETIADQTLFKGLDKDTRDKILRACPLPKLSECR